MNEDLKKQVGSQKELMRILGIKRTMAWKLWNNHSKLTTSNERLIKLTLGIK